jgi:hypothetical protein
MDMEIKLDIKKVGITREVKNKSKVYKAWASLQGRPIKYGSAGEYIGRKTILTMFLNSLTLFARDGTSRSDFEKEARALHFIQ